MTSTQKLLTAILRYYNLYKFLMLYRDAFEPLCVDIVCKKTCFTFLIVTILDFLGFVSSFNMLYYFLDILLNF